MTIYKFNFDAYTAQRMDAILRKTGAASYGDVVRQAIHLYDHALSDDPNLRTISSRSVLELRPDAEKGRLESGAPKSTKRPAPPQD